MAKRGAEFQVAKDSNGGPDFAFGGSTPTESGGLQPQRATAAQMAGRKIAAGRKTRVATTHTTTTTNSNNSMPQQPSSFSFSGAPSNSWSGSFGNTSATFGSGSNSTTNATEQKPFTFSGFGQSSSTDSATKSTFAPFGQSQSFGGGGLTTTSSISNSTPAPSNLFSFGTNASNSFPPDKSTSPSTNLFQPQPQPSTNGVVSTSSANPFQTQPTTNGVQSSTPSNPFSFSTNPSATTSSTFNSGASAKPSNLFDFGNKSASSPSLFSPTPTPAPARAAATNEKVARENMDRLKEFVSNIEPKFQSMDRFKQEVRAQVQSMPALAGDKTADQVVEDFAAQLQKAQPVISGWTTSSQTTPEFSASNMRLLLALLDKHVPAEKRVESNPFAPKPAENSNPFAVSAVAETAQKSIFTPQPASPAFSTSPAKSALDVPALREMLRNEVKQQLPSLLQAAIPNFDAGKLNALLPGLFTTSFSKLNPSDLPANVETSTLREAIQDGVSLAVAQLSTQRNGSALDENTVRMLFNQAFSSAVPSIRKSIEDSPASNRPTETNMTIEEGLKQLRTLREQCGKTSPPTTLATPPYSIEKLNSVQKQQYTGGWRVRLFLKAADEIARKFGSDVESANKIIAESERLRLSLADTVGLKRKRTPDAENVADTGPNKRLNFGSSTANGSSATPLFAAPTNSGSSPFSTPSSNSNPFGGNNAVSAAKQTREDAQSSPTKSGSQTSQLFASFAQKGQSETPPKSSSAQNIFAAAAAGSSTANVLKPPQFNVAPASGNNFMAQFNKLAAQTAEKDKAKRKAEDFDSEEETEEEWEKRDAEEQLAKKQKLMQNASSTGFTPTFGAKASTEASKDGDADNEDSTEEPSPDSSSKKTASTTPKAPAPTRSLFDRVQEAVKESASPVVAPNGDKTWKPDSPIRFGDPSTSLFSQSSSATSSSPNKAGLGDINSSKTLFGTTKPSSSTASSSLFSVKPSNSASSNPFAPADSANKSSAPSFNVTAATPEKTASDKPKNLFQFPSTSSGSQETGASQPKSLFGTSSSLGSAGALGNPFAHLSENSSVFSTPSASTSGSGLAPTSVFATAGSSRATSPGITTGDESTGSGAGEELPKDPQLDLSESRAGEEHEKSLFEVKAKASEYVPKDDDSGAREWCIRGVGQLRLLKHNDTGKTRVVLRAGPASRVVLNVALLPNTSYTNPTSKSVSFVASNSGRVAKWTLQVGKEDDAKKLKDLLEQHKND